MKISLKQNEYTSAVAWALVPPYRSTLVTTKSQKRLIPGKLKETLFLRNFGVKSGKLGELLVSETLRKRDVGVESITSAAALVNSVGNKQIPDFLTDNYIVEVKTSTWCTGGTAGEKVLAVPYKYAELPELYQRPLIIVGVAFQEWQMSNQRDMQVFGENVPNVRREMLDLWKKQNIHYVKFSDIVNGTVDLSVPM